LLGCRHGVWYTWLLIVAQYDWIHVGLEFHGMQ
jgi:hypothetical protein